MTNFNCLDGHKMKVSIAFVFVPSWQIESTQKSYTKETLIPGLLTKGWARLREETCLGRSSGRSHRGKPLPPLGPEGKVQGIVQAERRGRQEQKSKCPNFLLPPSDAAVPLLGQIQS